MESIDYYTLDSVYKEVYHPYENLLTI